MAGFFILKLMRKLVLGACGALLIACGSTSPVKPVEEGAAQNASNGYTVPANNGTEEVLFKTTEKLPKAKDFKQYVSPEALQRDVEFLASDALKGRETGTSEIEEAATYIIKTFQDAGVQPYFTSYRDKFDAKGKSGFNVVGVLEGTDPELKKEYVIIGAHYDHIGTAQAENGDVIANGANDNASGTATVMALARYFAKAKTNKRSILFALFSAEEMGLLGSAHLADRLKSTSITPYVMFNIEMVGLPMSDKDYTLYLTGYENSNLAQQFNAYAGAKVLGFLPQAKQYNLFKRSDNYAFYQVFKIPAQTVSTFDFSNFDHYHKVGDEASLMDYKHMANVANQLIPGLEGILTTPSQEIIWNE